MWGEQDSNPSVDGRNQQIYPKKEQKKAFHQLMKSFWVVGRAGFEPTKALPTDLQSAPFDRFGISPNIV